MKLFLMRHGQAENNILDIVSHSIGRWHLTPKGRFQVMMAASELAQSKVRIDGVFLSPLVRAQETCEIMKIYCRQIAAAPTRTMECLTEINMGDWNDRKRSIRSNKLFEIRSYERHLTTFSSFRLPKGESFQELGFRMAKFLFENIVKFDSKANILIISHADPLLSLQKIINFMTGQDIDIKFQDNAEIIKLDLSKDKILRQHSSLQKCLSKCI